jgi:D-arabinose 1-dehydrogenase-like Zn-dependent alcohol dehydrogenase
LYQIGKPLELRDVPIPQIAKGEVLVETRACGICGTDLHLMEGFAYVPKLPHIMGHEPSGVVRVVGSHVKRLQPGDRVVPHLFITCGQCWYCRTGRDSMCAKPRGIIGVLVNGAFAEFFKAPAENLFKLPDRVPFDEGGLVADAIITAVHAVYDRAHVKKGSLVAVLGIGGVGQVIVQLLKLVGAKVVSISRSEEKLAIARQLGSDKVVKAGSKTLGDEVRELASDGADCAIDCVGSSESMKDALVCVKRCGRIVMIGEEKALFPADTIRVAQHELELVGSRNGTRQNMEIAIRFLRDGEVKPLISKTFPLDDVNTALQSLRTGVPGRVVVRVSSGE